MKKVITLFMVGLFVSLQSFASNLSSNLTFSAKLTGDQEVPAVTTNAVGVASFVLNASRDTLCIHASVNGLSGAITLAHIHEGLPGVGGPVILDLVSYISGNTINATIAGAALTSEFISKMITGNYYINVHTAANPNGEIRGQIGLETDFMFAASMDGAQEVPAVTTTAIGYGVFDLYQNPNEIAFKVIVEGLSGDITLAHLHNGAPGVSGPVVQDLFSFVSGNVIEGEIDPTAYLSDLLAGNIYINVHTAANPNGEIRGQLVWDNKLAFDMRLDGNQEVPAVTTSANGIGSVKLNGTMDTMWYHVMATGLSGPATLSHFHNAAAGVSGGVVIDATANINGNVIDGIVTGSTLTSDITNNFLKGDMYFNIHTAANPGGEIRGQVYRYAREGYTFVMDGNQEVPATTSTATGGGLVSVDRFQENAHVMVVVSGLSGPLTLAHFHNNVAGQNGGVIYELTSWFSMTTTDDAAFGYWTDEDATPFSATQNLKFLHDSVYINVHTAANPGGEIRGQVNPGSDCFTTDFGTVGIASINDDVSEFSIYPNPAKDVAEISFDSKIASTATIQFVNIFGQVSSEFVTTLTHGSNLLQTDAGNFSSGIYLVRLIADGHAATIGKLIKQ